MLKLRSARTILAGIMVAMLFVAILPVTNVALAHDGHNHEPEMTTPGYREDDPHHDHGHGTADPMEAAKKTQAEVTAEKTRLKDTKLKTCQNREKRIGGLMHNMTDRASRQVMTFNRIAERTQDFYMEKGKTLSNYDALVADVYAKKAAAEAAIAKTTGVKTEFSCMASDPKGVSATFKENLKAQTDAMKAYKAAVKNLIVAVKSLHQSAKGN